MATGRSNSGSRGARPEPIRSWEEEFSRTWLNDEELVLALDMAYVRPSLLSVRSLPISEGQSVAPTSVQTLVSDVRRFGREHHWFWCTSALCLLTELILAARTGTTWKTAEIDGDVRFLAEPLRLLRNACFHPAHQAPGSSGAPPISEFIAWLEGNGEANLAERLAPNWAFLAHRPVASFALRKQDAVGRAFARALALR